MGRAPPAVSYTLSSRRKDPTLANMAGIFGRALSADDGKEQIWWLREKIGELTMEGDSLSEALGKFPGPRGTR